MSQMGPRAGTLAGDFFRQLLITAAVSVTIGLVVERWRGKKTPATHHVVVVNEDGEIIDEGEVEA